MKKVFFVQANYLYEFENTNINIIRFNNPKEYREFSQNVFENIVFSINNNVVDLNKYGMIIYNPFELNINDKKILNLVYKKLEKYIEDEERMIISKIEQESLKLFEKLSLNIDVSIDYNDSMDLNKLFGSFDIKISNDNMSFLEKIVQYVKLNVELFNIKIIISFGLLSLLEQQEIDLLNIELLQYGVVLVDAQYNINENNNSLYVEGDWCII